MMRRKARMVGGRGEAWFYITPAGIELRVAQLEGEMTRHVILLTASQLRRALQVIDQEAKG